MCYVSSRSGVVTLRTAIHLLLTYLVTYLHVYATDRRRRSLYSPIFIYSMSMIQTVQRPVATGGMQVVEAAGSRQFDVRHHYAISTP